MLTSDDHGGSSSSCLERSLLSLRPYADISNVTLCDAPTEMTNSTSTERVFESFMHDNSTQQRRRNQKQINSSTTSDSLSTTEQNDQFIQND